MNKCEAMLKLYQQAIKKMLETLEKSDTTRAYAVMVRGELDLAQNEILKMYRGQ